MTSKKSENSKPIPKKCSIKALSRALLKKALGYSVNEISEEFVSGENDELKLLKRKVTVKHIPPDIPAAKILLDMLNFQTNDIAAMSDEDLEREKKRLIDIVTKAGSLVKEDSSGQIDESTENSDYDTNITEN